MYIAYFQRTDCWLDAGMGLHHRFGLSATRRHVAICRIPPDKCERQRKLPIFVGENRVCSEKIVMYVADGWVQAENT